MKNSLSRQFIIILLIPILIITVTTCIILSYTYQKQADTLISQCSSTVENINLNMTSLTSNMQKAGRLFTASKETQELLLDTSADRMNRQSFSDSIEGTKSYLSDLTDIIIWNQKDTLSLVSYISLDMERFVTENLESAGSELNYFRFYINPQTQQIYMMHFSPIYVTSFSKEFSKHIGDVVIICKPRMLPQLINSVKDINLTIIDTATEKILYQNESTYSPQQVFHQISQPVSYTDLKITGTIMTDRSFFFYDSYIVFILLLIALSALYILYIAIAVQRTIIRPIHHLNSQIEKADHEQNNIQLDVSSDNEIGSIATQINELLAKITNLNQKNIASQTRLYEMEISKKQTQLYAYQSQINPHFLYNMLQCMRGISLMHGMKQVALICTNMADLFRYSIKGKNYVKLHEEFDIIDKYLYMIAVRFRDRISYTIHVNDNVKECAIPKMILQPLVENAIFHGLESIEEPGQLEISCYLEDEVLHVKIVDNGIGFKTDELKELTKVLTGEVPGDIFDTFNEKKGLGIINIHNKIQLYEGNQYGISIQHAKNPTIVMITLNPEPDVSA